MPIPIKNLDKNNSIKLFDKPAVMAKTTKNIRASLLPLTLNFLADVKLINVNNAAIAGGKINTDTG